MTYYRDVNEEEIEEMEQREADKDVLSPNWRLGKDTISAIQGREVQQPRQMSPKDDITSRLYVSEVEPEIEDLVRAIEGKEGFQPEVWEKLSPQERHHLLVEVHREVAKVYHFPEAKVEIANDLPQGVNGLHKEGLIQINHRLIEKEDPTKALETLLHESRHAYQDYMIKQPVWQIPQERREEVKKWRDNLEHYRSPNKYGFWDYYHQPVEVDARKFAKAIIRKLRLA